MLEAFENFYNISNEYDIRDKKVGAYLEAAQREFAINVKQAEIKVIEESGTDSDLQFLTEAAEEGLVTKLKNGISAIIKAFTEFISDLKDKVVRIIVKKESRDQLRKIEKKVKLNPLLSKKKVKISDKKAEMKLIKKYENECDKIIAKILAKGGNVQVNVIGGLQDSFDGSYRKVIAASAASMTITLGALVALINKQIDELPTALNGVGKDTSAALQKLLNSAIDDEAAASCKAAYSAVARFRSSLGKKEANLEVQSLMENVKEAKRALKIDKSKPVVGESVEDSYDYDYEDFTEGANLEIRSQLKALKAKYKGSITAIRDYRKSRDYTNAVKEVSNLESILSEYEGMINGTISTTGSVIFGLFTSWSVTFLRDFVNTCVIYFTTALAVSTTSGVSDENMANSNAIAKLASSLMVECNRLIEQWSKPVSKIVKGQKIELDDFNLYKNVCLSQVKYMKKNVGKLKPVIEREKIVFDKMTKIKDAPISAATAESAYDYEDFYGESDITDCYDFDFSEFEEEANDILTESLHDDDDIYNEYSAHDLLDDLDDIL